MDGSLKLAPCGIDCAADCGAYQKDCDGCVETAGQVAWAPLVGETMCRLYRCAVDEKKRENCASCAELPCKIFYDVKDPSIPDEQFETMLKRQVARLKGLEENG